VLGLAVQVIIRCVVVVISVVSVTGVAVTFGMWLVSVKLVIARSRMFME
jgi:hypothetical protein